MSAKCPPQYWVDIEKSRRRRQNVRLLSALLSGVLSAPKGDDPNMTLPTTLSPPHYAPVIAAAGSGSLASNFAASAPPETALNYRRSAVARGSRSGEPGDELNGSIWEQVPMVMLTNVDESLADARRRIQDEVTVAVTSWSNRSEAARRRLWRTWSIQYPALVDLDTTSTWNCTIASERDAMIDMLNLTATEPDAFTAWVTKGRGLLSHLTRTTTPADLADIAAVAIQADCELLKTFPRPFLTLYNRARRQTRKTLIAKPHHDAPYPHLNNPSAIDETNTIATMVAIDSVCRAHGEQRWERFLTDSLNDPRRQVLPARTRRTHRATYRTLIRAAI